MLACVWCSSSPATAFGTTTLTLDCPLLGQDQVAAFEARARAELLLRGARGALVLQCQPEARLTWTPSDGAARAGVAPDRSIEGLLSTLQRVLDRAPVESSTEPFPPPDPAAVAPAERTDAEPGLGFELRAGGAVRQWQDKPALGVALGAGFVLPLLTVSASGHLSRGLVSYSQTALHVLEGRAAAEVMPVPWLRLGAGVGIALPFATAPSGIQAERPPRTPWSPEAFVRASTPLWHTSFARFEAGAELAGSSRVVLLEVNDVRAYEFRWVPSLFVEAAFEFSRVSCYGPGACAESSDRWR